MIGPGLAGVWGREAATAEGFGRYSDALKRAGLVWNEPHPDAWLKNPAEVVPGTSMGFAGAADAPARVGLHACLKAASSGRVSAPGSENDGGSARPVAGHPVVGGNGMCGDRASVVFSQPQAIASLVRRQCP